MRTEHDMSMITSGDSRCVIVWCPSGITYVIAVGPDVDNPGRWMEIRAVNYKDKAVEDLTLNASFASREAAVVGAQNQALVALGLKRPSGYKSARLDNGEVLTIAL